MQTKSSTTHGDRRPLSSIANFFMAERPSHDIRKTTLEPDAHWQVLQHGISSFDHRFHETRETGFVELLGTMLTLAEYMAWVFLRVRAF